MVLDHVKVEQTSKVGEDEASKMLDRLAGIALTFGLDREKVLATPLRQIAGPVIDGEIDGKSP